MKEEDSALWPRLDVEKIQQICLNFLIESAQDMSQEKELKSEKEAEDIFPNSTDGLKIIQTNF